MAVPSGFHTLQPYLIVRDAAAASEFYQAMFEGEERIRLPTPDGGIGHCEVQVGDSALLLADEYPDMGYKAPPTLGGTPVTIHAYVDDVDSVTARAEDLGATVLDQPDDRFYGDRSSRVEDPFGHVWIISTRIKEMSEEELLAEIAKMDPS